MTSVTRAGLLSILRTSVDMKTYHPRVAVTHPHIHECMSQSQGGPASHSGECAPFLPDYLLVNILPGLSVKLSSQLAVIFWHQPEKCLESRPAGCDHSKTPRLAVTGV